LVFAGICLLGNEDKRPELIITNQRLYHSSYNVTHFHTLFNGGKSCKDITEPFL